MWSIHHVKKFTSRDLHVNSVSAPNLTRELTSLHLQHESSFSSIFSREIDVTWPDCAPSIQFSFPAKFSVWINVTLHTSSLPHPFLSLLLSFLPHLFQPLSFSPFSPPIPTPYLSLPPLPPLFFCHLSTIFLWCPPSIAFPFPCSSYHPLGLVKHQFSFLIPLSSTFYLSLFRFLSSPFYSALRPYSVLHYV